MNIALITIIIVLIVSNYIFTTKYFKKREESLVYKHQYLGSLNSLYEEIDEHLRFVSYNKRIKKGTTINLITIDDLSEMESNLSSKRQKIRDLINKIK